MRPMPPTIIGDPDAEPVRLLWDLMERIRVTNLPEVVDSLEAKATQHYLVELFGAEAVPPLPGRSSNWDA